MSTLFFTCVSSYLLVGNAILAFALPRLSKSFLTSTSCCSFCAQLFQYQQDKYRPSWEAKEAERSRIKDEQEAKQRKAFWDPLTTTELERKKEMAEMKVRLERGDDWVDPEILREKEEEPGSSVRLARKTLVRTTSSGRIVRERMKTEVSPGSSR